METTSSSSRSAFPVVMPSIKYLVYKESSESCCSKEYSVELDEVKIALPSPPNSSRILMVVSAFADNRIFSKSLGELAES